MSKINSITLAILSVLATSSSVWAEEETFDTHFMIGGLNGEKISRYLIDGDKPMPGTVSYTHLTLPTILLV